MKLRSLSDLVVAIEEATVLDAVVTPVRTAVQKLLARDRRVADALHGVPLGHPLHPLLAQGALGAFVSAGVLDALPGPRISSRVLIATGLALVTPAVLSGYADWSAGHEQQQRVGIVHSSVNAAATALYVASLVTRGTRGRALSFAGLGAVSLGGFLGGHLSYRQASGANHAEEVPHLVEPGWHDLGPIGELPLEGTAQRRLLDTTDTVPLLVARTGGVVRVLADRCSHLSGPLHQGEIADGCVTCPWHGTVFDLADGAVVHGPATSPQPAFATREVAGRLEVSLPNAG